MSARLLSGGNPVPYVCPALLLPGCDVSKLLPFFSAAGPVVTKPTSA